MPVFPEKTLRNMASSEEPGETSPSTSPTASRSLKVTQPETNAPTQPKKFDPLLELDGILTG
jgi:hypothetical protein